MWRRGTGTGTRTRMNRHRGMDVLWKVWSTRDVFVAAATPVALSWDLVADHGTRG